MSSRLRKCQTDAIVTYYTRRKNGERQTDLSLCTGAGKTLIIQEISQSERRVIIVFPWLTLLSQFWNDKNNPFKKHKCVRYFATEGTLEEVRRLDTKMDELDASDYVILTTYTSAPEVYSRLLTKGCSVDLLIHDEAHRAKRHLYSESLATIEDRIGHCVNLSATLPVPADYKYSLLRGIKDKVVRDFNMEIFLCTDIEREESNLFVEIVKQLQNNHPSLKLLVYTAEANTDGDNSSSVKTYLEQNQAAAEEKGWWMRGLYEETMSDRTPILNEFQEERPVSILVSCRTISEGVDLKNANCMMPWDASKSPIDNIQRIGRVLRLYKDDEGNLCPEHLQLPSTVFIPVFLTRSKYEICEGDKQLIHDVLNKEIELNANGNFMPFITVCAALKDELADQDEDLFNQLMNMPPKMKHTRNAVECLAKHLRKSADKVIDQMCVCGGGGDFVETIRSNEWADEEAGDMLDVLAMSQGLTLVVDDGENITRHGDGEVCVELKKNDNDDGYKVVNGNKVKREKKALERVSNRTKVKFSSDFTILLGIDDVDEDLIAQEKNFIATKLSASVLPDANWEKNRQKRNLFYESNGREPSEYAKNPDGTPNKEEQSMAHWIGGQRKAKKKFDNGVKNPRITQQRIDTLNNPEKTPGWKWEACEWEEKRQERNLFVQINGREPSAYAKNPDETPNKEEQSMAHWISKQRTAKKKFDNGVKNPGITPERIDILSDPEQTPGWKWEAIDHEAEWEEKRQERNLFYESNGREPSKHAKNPDGTPNKEEQSMAHWIGGQRTAKKKFDNGVKSKITPEHIDILSDPEQTPGWKWEAIDHEAEWEEKRQQRNLFYESNGREPSQWAKNPDETPNKKEQSMAKWSSRQRQVKKRFDNGEKSHITPEQIEILSDPEKTPGWKWEACEWEEKRQERNLFYESNGREPSTYAKNPDGTPNKKERSMANWSSKQRQAKKRFDNGEENPYITPERIDTLSDPEQTPGWKWSASKKKTESIIPSPPPTQNTILKRTPKRKLKIQSEKTYRNCSRVKSSKLTKFHRRFKSMKSTNYNATNVSREDFDAYHQEADKYDARDAEDIQGCANVERLLLECKPKCNRKTYHSIDLGCGMNRFRHRKAVQKMTWESLDIYAVDDTVTVGNIGDMKELYEEEEFDVGIANRALWGIDYVVMLSEIQRIMKTGGVVVFCEAVGRWIKKSEDKKTNILPLEIERCGLKLVKQEGTDICEDGTHDLWQYIVATK